MALQPYISPVMASVVRYAFNRGMQHTYTLLPYSVASRTAYGMVPQTVGTAVPDLPCRYLPKPIMREYQTGRVTIVNPSVTDDVLMTPWDATLNVGDHITNVRALPVDGEVVGRLLLLEVDGSPAEAVVTAELDNAGLGPITLRRFVLRNLGEQEVDPRG